MNKNQWIWFLNIPACLSAAFVVLAHPSEYGYYTLSRLLVTVAAAATAFLLWQERQGFGITFVVLAILFNPFIKVHLGRELWVVADIVAVILLIIGATLSQTTKSVDSN